jgi:PASTA domain
VRAIRVFLLSVAIAVLGLAGPAAGAGDKATSFPVEEYLTDVAAGRLFLGGDPPKIVGLKTVKEFSLRGRPVYVIQVAFRRARRDVGNGTFVVLKARTYADAVFHLFDVAPGTRKLFRVLFPKSLPMTARFPPLRAQIDYSLGLAGTSFDYAPHPSQAGVVLAGARRGIRPGPHRLVLRAVVGLAPHPMVTLYEVVEWIEFALDPIEVLAVTPTKIVVESLKAAIAAKFTTSRATYTLDVPALVPKLVGLKPSEATRALTDRGLVIALEKVPTTDKRKLNPNGAGRVFAQNPSRGTPLKVGSTVTVKAYIKGTPTTPVTEVLGGWKFGRVDGAFLCNVSLTRTPGQHGAFVLSACNANESFWRLANPTTIEFMHADGRVTTRFTRVDPLYWEGSYIEHPSVPCNGPCPRHYLSRQP